METVGNLKLSKRCKEYAKIVVSLLLVVLFTMSSATQVFASGDEDNKLREEAFNSVKRVIEIANKNSVKPFKTKFENSLEPGISSNEDVIKAVNDGLQLAINEARDKINKIPNSSAEYKSNLVFMIDNYQTSILYTIDNIIKTNELNPKQSDIILGRVLIKNLIPDFKGAYSGQLDKLQQSILNKANELIIIAEKTKKKEDYQTAEAYIKEIKNMPDELKSADIIKVYTELDFKLNKIKDIDKIERIIKMPSVEIGPNKLDIELPEAIPENYDLYITFDWIKSTVDTKLRVDDLKKSYLYNCFEGNGVNKKVSIPMFCNKIQNTTLPVQGNYLLYLVNKSTQTVEYISENPIRLSLGVESTNTKSEYISNEGITKTSLAINSKAKYTGYITHEFTSKNRSIQINHNVLVTEGDTPEVIIEKINKSIKEIFDIYAPWISIDNKENKIIISTYQSEELRSRIQ